MAFKGSVHRGTPINVIRAGGAGIKPGKPPGMSGTSKEGFSSEKSGYRDAHVSGHGTVYNSDAGNPRDARRGGTDRYGLVASAGGQDYNDPRANGDGVVLDRMSGDYNDPTPAPHLDSSVPREAARFDTDAIAVENKAHLGKGQGPTAPNDAMGRDDLLAIGGVMSK
jgi:hypothetical protein